MLNTFMRILTVVVTMMFLTVGCTGESRTSREATEPSDRAATSQVIAPDQPMQDTVADSASTDDTGAAAGRGDATVTASPEPAVDAETATAQAAQNLQAAMPHIHVDREARVVDLEATVLHTSDWLELIACSPETREHESLVTVTALPQHVHLALLLIGLEPGKPFQWHRGPQREFIPVAPTGPFVRLFFVYEKDGQQVEVPANLWIIDRETREPLADNLWHFTGSRTVTGENDSNVYIADHSGNVASIVNFRDEVLSRPTIQTHQDDGQQFAANKEIMPPPDTKVILRIRPE